MGGISFQWRREQYPERNFGNETMFGFLVQDVEKYFPEVVRRDADGWRRIQGGAFEPLLTEGYRSHDQRIVRLEEEIRTMQDENRALRESEANLRREVLSLTNSHTALRADLVAIHQAVASMRLTAQVPSPMR